MEPNLSDQTEAVLYAPTAGIVCPFLLNIAMAENACTNGVEFRLQYNGHRLYQDRRGMAGPHK